MDIAKTIVTTISPNEKLSNDWSYYIKDDSFNGPHLNINVHTSFELFNSSKLQDIYLVFGALNEAYTLRIVNCTKLAQLGFQFINSEHVNLIELNNISINKLSMPAKKYSKCSLFYMPLLETITFEPGNIAFNILEFDSLPNIKQLNLENIKYINKLRICNNDQLETIYLNKECHIDELLIYNCKSLKSIQNINDTPIRYKCIDNCNELEVYENNDNDYSTIVNIVTNCKHYKNDTSINAQKLYDVQNYEH